jgi:peptidoglycan/LPS O-acetylase OafA/YrhL
MSPNSNYRPDIDGLRAVAVILVLLFHLGLGIPCGYIGVDVFFVISGYLITEIISRQMEQGEFSFMAFYARRARRILPAFLAVLLFSSIAALFILLLSNLERYAKSEIAALFSVSYFWFWSQGGYFGSASEMAPLVHTWSLAVEEQFYLVLPIALLLMHRWVPLWTRSLVLLACLGTFAAAAWFVPTRTPEVFYFSPFHAWELMLGSLLALFRLPVVAAGLHRQWIAAVGLLLILVPAVAYTAETVFPGPAAALPCVGAALLIWVNASGESGVGRLLKCRALVFIGLISYSLYLWHWPLLVFAKHAVGESLGLEVRFAIGSASLVLATLSWRFIEAPFRSTSQTSSRQAWTFAGTSVGLLGAVVVAELASQGLTGRYDPQVAALDRARTRDVMRGECINLRSPLEANTVCRIGATDALE